MGVSHDFGWVTGESWHLIHLEVSRAALLSQHHWTLFPEENVWWFIILWSHFNMPWSTSVMFVNLTVQLESWVAICHKTDEDCENIKKQSHPTVELWRRLVKRSLNPSRRPCRAGPVHEPTYRTRRTSLQRSLLCCDFTCGDVYWRHHEVYWAVSHKTRLYFNVFTTNYFSTCKMIF